MRTIAICFTLFFSSFASYAEQAPKVFEPYAEFRIGIVSTELSTFTEQEAEINGGTDFFDGLIGGSLLYHFTDKWAMSIQVESEIRDCT
ncbi:MAG: hypothetical protein HRT38_18500 [Alteromonadaceae bacterium]|nr:hypothetical protein [Alteromonadaceae bacterium]